MLYLCCNVCDGIVVRYEPTAEIIPLDVTNVREGRGGVAS